MSTMIQLRPNKLDQDAFAELKQLLGVTLDADAVRAMLHGTLARARAAAAAGPEQLEAFRVNVTPPLGFRSASKPPAPAGA